MSTAVTGKKQCVSCTKSGGIMTCNGCQQTFCGKHVIEHRQELVSQLEGIMQDHNLFQQELGQSSFDNSVLEQQIDLWEKESITKIQVTAEAARADLRQMLEKSKEQISKACQDIAVNLRSSHDTDDFSEHDLNRWIEQLKELKLEATSSSSIRLIEDEYSTIPLIAMKHNSFTNKNSITSDAHERFSQISGDGTLEEEGTVVKHTDRNYEYVYILGERLYVQGRQTVRFKIEYEENVYNMFFGCVSSKATDEEIHFCSPVSVGWFGYNELFYHGNPCQNIYDSNEIKTNDILSLTLDCEKQQIELYHERENKIYTLQVDIRKANFPWRLLVVLCHPNNCVRILPNVQN
jgi:hypothetical protein